MKEQKLSFEREKLELYETLITYCILIIAWNKSLKQLFKKEQHNKTNFFVDFGLLEKKEEKPN